MWVWWMVLVLSFFVYLAWSIAALAQGKYPDFRHDGTEWSVTDAIRSRLAGTYMRFRAVIIDINGDWAELANTHGFASWFDSMRPCLFAA